eukprot:CAMPEP_0173095678 /NCGR_PEP_ID=MMETSP1102-20130122/32186_1 /TAXON_ID=49646 /ORGANISM="Geminigera sp., Strain Caron Lab Isolate" /LENGTH=261 /DNA_ID=CAMNT_0013985845 /DNA_START=68 /DNA_END=854 /DNA_ORIENTATION=-
MLEARGLPRYISPAEIAERHSLREVERLWLQAVGAGTLDHFKQTTEPSQDTRSGEPVETAAAHNGSGQAMFGALIRRMNLLSEIEAEIDSADKTDESNLNPTKGIGMRRSASCEMLGAIPHRDNDTAGVENHAQSFSGSAQSFSGSAQAPRQQMPLAPKINHKARGLGVVFADDQLPLSSTLFNELANVEPLIQLCLLPLQPNFFPVTPFAAVACCAAITNKNIIMNRNRQRAYSSDPVAAGPFDLSMSWQNEWPYFVWPN